MKEEVTEELKKLILDSYKKGHSDGVNDMKASIIEGLLTLRKKTYTESIRIDEVIYAIEQIKLHTHDR
jgi:predicted SnoaL-like aldol condensation-catalyzing enzyme